VNEMLLLSKVRISNFRSCQKVECSLSDFTPLIGYNNGGKSNILNAITWLIKPSVLTNSDFNNPSNPVIIEGCISGITEVMLEKLDETHRKRISKYCINNSISIRRKQFAPGGSLKDITLEISNDEFSCDSDSKWEKNLTGIDTAIKAILPDLIIIGAMEDVLEDVGKSTSGSTIGKLISEIMEPIEIEHGNLLENGFSEIRKLLQADGNKRAPELLNFDEGINECLKDIFPGLNVRLHIPAPSVRDLFKNGTIKIYENQSDCGRDVSDMGTGSQRSIQMALVRYLSQIKFDRDPSLITTLLIIDEPELYMHPQAIEQVRIALKALSIQGYQVIFATHSASMIESEDIEISIIIYKIRT